MKRSLLKDNAPLFEWLMRLLDPLLVVLAGWLAYRWYLHTWNLPERYLLALIGVALFCFALFPLLRLYSPQRGVTLFEEAGRLANAWLLIAAAWFGYLFLSKSGADFSRAWSLYWIVFGAATHFAFRAGIRLVLRALRRRGYNQRYVVIVGAGRLGQDIARRLALTPWSGLCVRGFYDDNPTLAGTRVAGIEVRGAIDRAARDLATESIDQVWIALPLRADARIRELLLQLRRHSVEVRLVPDIFNYALLNHSMTEVAGLPVINLTESPLSGGNRVIKGAEDFVLSLLLLIVALPVMLLIALGVKMSSRGPVFYAQERVTWNGRHFMMRKFRTMPVDAEATTGPVWASSGEHRATPFGAFLRRTSLDELPQLINVLRGDMSLVGPRPERPEFVEQFRRQIPGYMQKHLVKAGITGWAQVNDLRGDTDLTRRIEYDLYYIDNWSLIFDLRILCLTLWHILTSRNAH
jgi:putative colanic acid biosysnthesis UDP-glucose lipid carrier transferase